MTLVDDFFRNFMRVRLNKPMRASLDLPFAALPIEAIIIPRVDTRKGPIFEFYDVSDANLPIHPPVGDLHQVVVRTRDGHSIETVLSSWGPVAFGLTSTKHRGTPLCVTTRILNLRERSRLCQLFVLRISQNFWGRTL